MSDTPKPWFMFGKDNDSGNSDDNDNLEQMRILIMMKILYLIVNAYRMTRYLTTSTRD